MKHKTSAAVMAAVMALSLMTGCGDKKSGGSAVATESGYAMLNPEAVNEKFKDYPDLDSGPEIYLSNTTAKAGELAKVTLSVKNADLQWNMCGIHVTYPEVLKPELSDPAENRVRFDKGEALEAASTSICMEWAENREPMLEKNKKGCLFFTTMFSDNQGMDGDIATFYLKVPDNAQSGAVYDLGYFFLETDMFSNMQNIPSFSKYAFTHMYGGTITVE